MVFQRHACRGRYILEVPVAEVAIQNAGNLEAAEEQVAPAVAVHVARSHASARGAQSILEFPLFRDVIRERDAGRGRGKALQKWPPAGGHAQRPAAVALACLPIGGASVATR